MRRQTNPATFPKTTFLDKPSTTSRFHKLHPIKDNFSRCWAAISLENKRSTKKGVLQTSDSTAAKSARNRSVEETISENIEELMIDTEKEQTGGNIEQNATEMKYDMKYGSREDEKENNINNGMVSEHIEDPLIDTEKEQTGRNI